jgi:ADP-heptose:LPS heptosyltransferase
LAQGEIDEAERLWREIHPERTEARRVVVAPGSGLAQKSWPVDRFRQVVESLARRPELDLAVVAGPAEVERAARVAAGRVVSLAGRLDLRQTCALFSRSDLVLANSSFAFHAAAAVGCPAIAVLGPAFHSARHHQRQWGYEGWTSTLGPERDEGRGISSVDEVEAEVGRWLEVTAPRTR